jgi:hypothetical protein
MQALGQITRPFAMATRRKGDPSLHLQPWQLPPCDTNLDSALREPFGDASGRREAGEVLKRLLALGLSRYEPDPMRAIAQAEQPEHLNAPNLQGAAKDVR